MASTRDEKAPAAPSQDAGRETAARRFLRTLREVFRADPHIIAAAERAVEEMERLGASPSPSSPAPGARDHGPDPVRDCEHGRLMHEREEADARADAAEAALREARAKALEEAAVRADEFAREEKAKGASDVAVRFLMCVGREIRALLSGAAFGEGDHG